MSTKFVPLTTRPLSTSRQGITRFSSTPSILLERVDALAHGEAPLVECLSGDHAGEVHEAKIAQRAKVVDRRDPSGVDEAAADDLGHAPYLLEVGPVEHPITIHVRVDELLHPAPLHAL